MAKDAPIEQIRSETSYYVPLPEYLPEGCNLRRTLQGLNRKVQPVELLYTCDMRIVMFRGRFPEPRRKAQEATDGGREAFVAEVMNVEAYAGEPHEVEGDYFPGAVIWEKNGIRYSIFGSFSVEELLKVARSLR